ncbi:hypothetical protein GDO86_008756 [Hymenochirus boettgeri]|uniref:Ferritin n=1 Tax=Hymenochirus boettgeri TaxID=247094 RepID=A0A8T2J4A9_9PIPI|nr:hypothetical protein GDO86_008756 [Hymenochirus boettgeri]
MTAQIREGFHQECEAALNRQVNMELFASYTYLSMACYFDRDDVALKNFSKYFLKQSHDERLHAEKLLKYQIQRGGRVCLKDVRKPEREDWGSGLEAIEAAFNLEKTVNKSLLDIHKLASQHEDPHLAGFLESNYLDEQVKSIKELGDHLTNLRKIGAPCNGLAEYLFDKHTIADLVKN